MVPSFKNTALIFPEISFIQFLLSQRSNDWACARFKHFR